MTVATPGTGAHKFIGIAVIRLQDDRSLDLVMSESPDFIEGSLWKLKKGVAHSSWKRNWVRADGKTIQQWTSATAPSPKEKPKYVLQTADCEIEESRARKFCFRVRECSTQTTLVLATDSNRSCHEWVQFLFMHCGTDPVSDAGSNENLHEGEPLETIDANDNSVDKRGNISLSTGADDTGLNQARTGNMPQISQQALEEGELYNSNDEIGGSYDDDNGYIGRTTSHYDSHINVDERPYRTAAATSDPLPELDIHTATNICLEYFQEHDVSLYPENPCIYAANMAGLLEYLDGTMNVQVIISLMMQDLNIPKGGVVTLQDFGDWWNSHPSLTQQIAIPRNSNDGEGGDGALATSSMNFIFFHSIGDDVNRTVAAKSIRDIPTRDSVHLVGFTDMVPVLPSEAATAGAGSMFASSSSRRSSRSGSPQHPLHHLRNPLLARLLLPTSPRLQQEVATATATIATTGTGAGGLGNNVHVRGDFSLGCVSALCDTIHPIELSSETEIEDWNDLYQTALEHAAYRMQHVMKLGTMGAFPPPDELALEEQEEEAEEEEEELHQEAEEAASIAPAPAPVATTTQAVDPEHHDAEDINGSAAAIEAAQAVASTASGSDAVPLAGAGAGEVESRVPQEGAEVPAESAQLSAGTNTNNNNNNNNNRNTTTTTTITMTAADATCSAEGGDGGGVTTTGATGASIPSTSSTALATAGGENGTITARSRVSLGGDSQYSHYSHSQLHANPSSTGSVEGDHVLSVLPVAATRSEEVDGTMPGGVDTAATAGAMAMDREGAVTALSAEQTSLTTGEAAASSTAPVKEQKPKFKPHSSEYLYWKSALKSVLDLSAIKGHFYRTAMDGVRCVIDEYGLPDEFKSATRLHSFEQLLSGAVSAGAGVASARDDANIEVFGFNGMLFSILAVPSHPTADAITDNESQPTSSATFSSSSSSSSSTGATRNESVVAMDEVTSKIAGNELRNTLLLQRAIEAVEAQAELQERVYLHRMHAAAEDMEELLAGIPLSRPKKASTLLTTLVDYAGFRVSVLSNALVDEPHTLVYGLSSSPVSVVATKATTAAAAVSAGGSQKSSTTGAGAAPLLPPAAEPVGEQGEEEQQHQQKEDESAVIPPPPPPEEGDGDEAQSFVEEEQEERLYITAIPEVQHVLSLLGKQLNLSEYQRNYLVSSVRTCDRRPNRDTNGYLQNMNKDTEAQMSMSVLSQELQAHLSTDGRLYLMNVKSLMPSALPRADTFDVLTHQLRSECVLLHPVPVFSDILQQTSQFDKPPYKTALGTILPPTSEQDQGVEEDKQGSDMEQEEAREAKAAPAADGGAADGGGAGSGDEGVLEHQVMDEAARTLDAAVHSLIHTLPLLAHSLDDYAIVPVDSFGLTELLHAKGLNCRHLGILHALCKSSSVKQILLAEAIARTTKSILKTQLKALARRTRAMVLRAAARGRSMAHHYTEYVGDALAQRKALVLELFNLVLGWGPGSDLFWQTTLCDALSKKFGITSYKDNLVVQLHWPQLFLSMQFHTGTRFHNVPFYTMCNHHHPEPFLAQHIAEYFIPSAKMGIILPGEFGRLVEMGDKLLMNGLFAEASSVFELQYRTLTAAFTDAPQMQQAGRSFPVKHQAATGHALYKQALCQYLTGHIAAAGRSIRTYLKRNTRFHPVTGRFLTLLMCTEYKMGRLPEAMQYFDAAQEVYSYTLGPNHPIISMHINCLAELYRQPFHYAPYANGGRIPAARKQALVLKILAQGTSKKSLGATNMVTALLESELAVMLLRDEHSGSVGEAIVLLESCVDILRKATTSTMSYQQQEHVTAAVGEFDHELARSLYVLSLCLSIQGEVDRAGYTALQCLDVALRVPIHRYNIYPLITSTYLHLCDLALQKYENRAAMNMLQHAWEVLQTLPSPFCLAPWVGQAMAVLARRILVLLVSQMPMAQGSLFESVAADWYSEQERKRYQHLHKRRRHQEKAGQLNAGVGADGEANELDLLDEFGMPLQRGLRARENNEVDDVEEEEDDDITVSTTEALSLEAVAQAHAWEQACQAVFDAIWECRPVEYFDMIVKGIQQKILSNEDDDETSQSAIPLPHTQASYSAQAAVISKLVAPSSSSGGVTHTLVNL